MTQADLELLAGSEEALLSVHPMSLRHINNELLTSLNRRCAQVMNAARLAEPVEGTRLVTELIKLLLSQAGVDAISVGYLVADTFSPLFEAYIAKQ